MATYAQLRGALAPAADLDAVRPLLEQEPATWHLTDPSGFATSLTSAPTRIRQPGPGKPAAAAARGVYWATTGVAHLRNLNLAS